VRPYEPWSVALLALAACARAPDPSPIPTPASSLLDASSALVMMGAPDAADRSVGADARDEIDTEMPAAKEAGLDATGPVSAPDAGAEGSTQTPMGDPVFCVTDGTGCIDSPPLPALPAGTYVGCDNELHANDLLYYRGKGQDSGVLAQCLGGITFASPLPTVPCPSGNLCFVTTETSDCPGVCP
jgi:hypothetical protein